MKTQQANTTDSLPHSFFVEIQTSSMTDSANYMSIGVVNEHDLKSATSLASFKNGLNSVDFSKYIKGSAFRYFLKNFLD